MIFAVFTAVSISACMLNCLAGHFTLQFKHNVHRPRLTFWIDGDAILVLFRVKVAPRCVLFYRILPPVIPIRPVHRRFLRRKVVVIAALYQCPPHCVKDAVAITVKPYGVGRWLSHGKCFLIPQCRCVWMHSDIWLRWCMRSKNQ